MRFRLLSVVSLSYLELYFHFAQPSLSSGGKPIGFGGVFDIISTYNPDAW